MKRTDSYALGALLLFGCLPVDSRPPPGRAHVTVSTDDIAGGYTTEDGWLVTYERALISIGNFGIAEGPCEEYAQSHYVRILDLLRPEPQKLLDLYALGECAFLFEVRQPPAEVVLGAGVSAEDEAFMRALGTDPYVAEERGSAIHFTGSATRGDEARHFAWSVRENLVYGNLFGFGPDGAAMQDSCPALRFTSEATTLLELHLSTASLFVDPELNGDDRAHFDPFAAADTDGDGEITFVELDDVPFDGGGLYPTLGERFYRKSAVELVGVGGVVCPAGRFEED